MTIWEHLQELHILTYYPTKRYWMTNTSDFLLLFKASSNCQSRQGGGGGQGVQTVKPLHKVEAHLGKMHLLSTGHINACPYDIHSDNTVHFRPWKVTHCLWKHIHISPMGRENPKVYHKFVVTCSMPEGYSCGSSMQWRGKKKLSQNFLYNKSMQLLEMMKSRPCDLVQSSSACTTKTCKEALTDIGEN